MNWNFLSICEADQAVNAFVNAQFRLMPGQAFFTSHAVAGPVIGAARWTRGRDDKVSMRVGLIPVKTSLPDDFTFKCPGQWLDISVD